MTFRRDPSPPTSDSPSVLLLRAIGDLQMIDGGEPITDMEAIAFMCGLVWSDLDTYIEVGIAAGYLDACDCRAVGLSAKAQKWYERDLLRRE